MDKKSEVLSERLAMLQNKHHPPSEIIEQLPPEANKISPRLLLNDPSQDSLKMINGTVIPKGKVSRQQLLSGASRDSSFNGFSTEISKLSFSNRARSTFRDKHVTEKEKKLALLPSPIRHRFIRERSPAQMTLPRDFSPRRDVAYLFEED